MTVRPDGIEEIFREALGIEVPSPSTDVIETGLIDSLSLVALLAEIEQRFAVRMPLEDLDIESLRSTETIAALVERLAAEQGADGGQR
jgi:acyl carrier protein